MQAADHGVERGPSFQRLPQEPGGNEVDKQLPARCAQDIVLVVEDTRPRAIAKVVGPYRRSAKQDTRIGPGFCRCFLLHMLTAVHGTHSPFAALHKFGSYRGFI